MGFRWAGKAYGRILKNGLPNEGQFVMHRLYGFTTSNWFVGFITMHRLTKADRARIENPTPPDSP